MVGVVSGSVLLLLALVPGLWPSLLHDLEHGIRTFRDFLFFSEPLAVRTESGPEPTAPPRAPLWLAAVGVLLMVLSVAAFV